MSVGTGASFIINYAVSVLKIQSLALNISFFEYSLIVLADKKG